MQVGSELYTQLLRMLGHAPKVSDTDSLHGGLHFSHHRGLPCAAKGQSLGPALSDLSEKNVHPLAAAVQQPCISKLAKQNVLAGQHVTYVYLT